MKKILLVIWFIVGITSVLICTYRTVSYFTSPNYGLMKYLREDNTLPVCNANAYSTDKHSMINLNVYDIGDIPLETLFRLSERAGDSVDKVLSEKYGFSRNVNINVYGYFTSEDDRPQDSEYIRIFFDKDGNAEIIFSGGMFSYRNTHNANRLLESNTAQFGNVGYLGLSYYHGFDVKYFGCFPELKKIGIAGDTVLIADGEELEPETFAEAPEKYYPFDRDIEISVSR